MGGLVYGKAWGGRWTSRIICVILSLTFITGCQSFQSSTNEATVSSTSDDLYQETQTLQRKFESAYESLGNRDSLDRAYTYLKQIRPEIVGSRWYNKTICEINYYMATYMDIAMDSSKMLYDEGRTAATTILSGHSPTMRFLNSDRSLPDTPLADSLETVPVDALYWWSLHTLLWSVDEPPITRMIGRQRIERAITLIEAVNPDYRYDAVLRLRGLLCTISPDGDLNEAREAFNQSVSLSGAYLENRFLYGRYYGTMLQNRLLFRTQMEKVINATHTYPLEFQELNELVKSRAREFLVAEDSFFSASTQFRLNSKK